MLNNETSKIECEMRKKFNDLNVRIKTEFTNAEKTYTMVETEQHKAECEYQTKKRQSIIIVKRRSKR